MLRVVLAGVVLLSLAFGASAAASPPPIVVESVAFGNDGGTTLRFTARFADEFDASHLPQTGTAVVMQNDGQRSKCINVSLVRTSVDGGIATYVGRMSFTYQGASVLAGRADIGGSIFDFSAPLDGSPGVVQKSGETSVQSTGTNTVASAVVITPQPVTITPDPATTDPRTAAATAAAQTSARAAQGAAAPATPTLVDGLAANTMPLLGLIVVLVAIVSAYFDRKRSLARTTAS